MAELNTIYYSDRTKQLLVNNTTNELIISGYSLVTDSALNQNLRISSPPSEPNSFGVKGSTAFDDDYIYYCVEDNSWARLGLSQWKVTKQSAGTAEVPNPTNWWKFTTNEKADVGSYEFTNYGATFSSSGAYLPLNYSAANSQGFNTLLNHGVNLVEPSSFNENFTISFETKRLNINSRWGNQFILGSAFGKLGFHFEYTNSVGTAIGNHLSFKLSTHNRPTYSWKSVQTTGQVLDSNYHQVVAVNDAFKKAIFLYFDGVLQGSGVYVNPGSYYDNPRFQGFAIGGNPNGASSRHVEYTTPLIIRNLGFWKGLALASGNAQSLYNRGNFISFPF